jgi:hypothetical protein
MTPTTELKAPKVPVQPEEVALSRADEAVKEPGKAWRNKWHSSVGWLPCAQCGGDHTIEGTDQWWGCVLHKSEGDAEIHARLQLDARRHEPATAYVTWLGAFPIEVTP